MPGSEEQSSRPKEELPRWAEDEKYAEQEGGEDEQDYDEEYEDDLDDDGLEDDGVDAVVDTQTRPGAQLTSHQQQQAYQDMDAVGEDEDAEEDDGDEEYARPLRPVARPLPANMDGELKPQRRTPVAPRGATADSTSPAAHVSGVRSRDVHFTLTEDSGQRSLSVVVLGTPNAGKSQLVNALVRGKVSAVSPKANTTRGQVLGVFTEGNTQLVYHDTPGVNASDKQRMYQKQLTSTAWAASDHADHGLLVIDAAKRMSAAEYELLSRAKEYCKKHPAFRLHLVLNKCDLLPGTLAMMDKCDEVAKLAPFEEVFYISALSTEGVEDIEQFLMDEALPREWDFDPDTITDLSLIERATEMIREKVFQRTHQEIPYRVKQHTLAFREQEDGAVKIEQQIIVQTTAHKVKLIGTGGDNLRWIGEQARIDIEQMLGRPVHLLLRVSVKKPGTSRLGA